MHQNYASHNQRSRHQSNKLAASGTPIHYILDMMRTKINVSGQMLVPMLVAKETRMLDKQAHVAPTGGIKADHLFLAQIAWIPTTRTPRR